MEEDDVFLNSVRRYNKIMAQIERGEIASDPPDEPTPEEPLTETVNNSRTKEPTEKQKQQKPTQIKNIKKAYKDPARQIQHKYYRHREMRMLRDSLKPTRPLTPLPAIPEKELEKTMRVHTSPPIYAKINLIAIDDQPDEIDTKGVDDVEHVSELLKAVQDAKRSAKDEERPALELKEKKLQQKSNILNKPTLNQPHEGFTYVEQEGAPMLNVETTPNSNYYNVISNVELAAMGTYSQLPLNSGDSERFFDWAMKQNIPNPVCINHHVSLVSSSEPHVYEPLGDLRRPIDVDPNTYKLHCFPQKDNDDYKTLVLLFENPHIVDLHQRSLDMGIPHAHEQYTPHVTISYKYPVEKEIDEITPPNFGFRLEKEISPPWDDNFVTNSTLFTD